MASEDLKTDTPPGGLFLILGTVTGIQALATLAILALATVAPVASVSYGIGAEMIGYQVSLMYVAAASISAIGGTLVRRWGAGTISQVTLVVGILGILGIASGNLVLLVVGSLLIGIGYGLPNPAASHLLFKATPTHLRNFVFSLKQTGVPIGGIIAGLLLPAVTVIAGWQAALLAAAGLSALLAIGMIPLRARWDTDRDPTARMSGSSVTDGVLLIWRHRPLRGLALMGFCFAALQLSLLTFVITMLVQDLGWSLVLAGGVVAIMQGVGALGRIAWGVIADRLGNGLVVLATIGVLSCIATLVTALLSPTWPVWAVATLLCFFGICAVGWNGVFLAEIARLANRNEVGTATGGALFFTFTGVVLAPSLFAAVYPLTGAYTTTFALMTIFPAVGTLSIFIFRPRPTR